MLVRLTTATIRPPAAYRSRRPKGCGRHPTLAVGREDVPGRHGILGGRVDQSVLALDRDAVASVGGGDGCYGSGGLHLPSLHKPLRPA